MKGSKSRGKKASSRHQGVTEVRCVKDLHAALEEIVASYSRGAVNQLDEILEALRREFDPSSVTMTTTNIPDAITKLSSVVAETTEAATRVFRLVERQKSLLTEQEKLSSTLETELREQPINVDATLKLVAKEREIQASLGEVAHEIVMAQEFQDLCGQKVDKVITLLSNLDGRLRALLSQFKVAPHPPTSASQTQDDADIGQDDADAILKGFGI